MSFSGCIFKLGTENTPYRVSPPGFITGRPFGPYAMFVFTGVILMVCLHQNGAASTTLGNFHNSG